MGKGLTTKFHLYSRLRFMLLDYTNGKEPKFKDLEKFHNDIKDACISIDDIKDLSQMMTKKERWLQHLELILVNMMTLKE
jgi:hypothetical protein